MMLVKRLKRSRTLRTEDVFTQGPHAVGVTKQMIATIAMQEDTKT